MSESLFRVVLRLHPQVTHRVLRVRGGALRRDALFILLQVIVGQFGQRRVRRHRVHTTRAHVGSDTRSRRNRARTASSTKKKTLHRESDSSLFPFNEQAALRVIII